MDNNEQLTRLEDKVDKIADTGVKQEVNLARLTVSVEEHVRRTNILEEQIKPLIKQSTIISWVCKVLALLISGGVLTLALQHLLH